MKQQPARATRFAIRMPLRYRETGEANWRDGKVENISRSGVLFTVEKVSNVNARIEMIFELPIRPGGAKAGAVYCEGQVVRTVLSAATDQPPSIAARIERYRLMQKDRLPEI